MGRAECFLSKLCVECFASNLVRDARFAINSLACPRRRPRGISPKTPDFSFPGARDSWDNVSPRVVGRQTTFAHSPESSPDAVLKNSKEHKVYEQQ